MTAVSSLNQYSQAWVLVRDWLKENMTDPINATTSSTRKWIYNKMPDVSRNFEGYPFIVAGDTGIDTVENTFGIGRQERVYLFPLTIYTNKVDNKYGLNHLDTLSDELRYKIYRQTSLDTNGLHSANITDSPSDELTIDGKKVFARNFGLTFHGVMEL